MGGLADAKRGSRIWSRDTLVSALSCTSAAAPLWLRLLEIRDGLDPDMPIAGLWPEFAAEKAQRRYE
jgi:hypothetical protein